VAPFRVMLIDDDQFVRTILVEWLEDAGFEVMEFSDPRKALETFGSGLLPHVLITQTVRPTRVNSPSPGCRLRRRSA
jgi:CheY-like chemotaxis protein